VSETILFPSAHPLPPEAPAPLVVGRKPSLSPSSCLPWALLVVLVLSFVWYVAHGRHPDGPEPPVDAIALGRSFAPKLTDALADGFDAEADALEAGKSVAQADEVLKTVFHDARARAFATHAAEAFAAVVPSGGEPGNDDARKAFARMHRDFAKGLRSVR
jgi:hypothetical protein